jgi:hypothetical protein
MGYHDFEVLRISPQYTADDWANLDMNIEADWSQAVKIARDRIDGRFLQHARICLDSPNSGFVVLAVDSLLLETLQQFRCGVTDGCGRSGQMVRKYLGGSQFQPEFDKEARKAFYSDIRCGLLHQAEAKRMWLVRRDQDKMLCEIQNADGNCGYVIDVMRFHGALEQSFDDYLSELIDPEKPELRSNLWKKMNHICGIRRQRVGLFS